jgi:hypothetical protein
MMDNGIDEILGKDCCGQDIIPIKGMTLSQHTNRHTNCDGTSWGWIEGCTLNICWSNNETFNSKAASEIVSHYNSRKEAHDHP